jgi:hypothetical protein
MNYFNVKNLSQEILVKGKVPSICGEGSLLTVWSQDFKN